MNISSSTLPSTTVVTVSVRLSVRLAFGPINNRIPQRKSGGGVKIAKEGVICSICLNIHTHLDHLHITVPTSDTSSTGIYGILTFRCHYFITLSGLSARQILFL